MISEFKGKYRFLSNFYLSPFSICGIQFITVEHFYQAMKTNDYDDFTRIVTAETPGEAKKLGRNVMLREDWEHIKEDVMFTGLEAKFNQNPDLKQMLIDIGSQVLQEGNYWNDKYWGIDLKTGKGKNRLGILLMRLGDKYIMEDNINGKIKKLYPTT